MMPKIGAQYVIKKLADDILNAPVPAPAVEPASQVQQAIEGVETDGESIHGQVIADEDGNAIGKAMRMRGIAVYFAWDGYGDPRAEFEACLRDPDRRLYLVEDDDLTTGLILAHAEGREVDRPTGMRADDL